MKNDHFKASTQYEDLGGSVAADHAETTTIEGWLNNQNLLQSGESLVGTTMHYGELPASGELQVSVSFLVAPSNLNLRVRIPGEDSSPTIFVRQIHREMPLAEFMRFFKRLELTLSSQGEFENRSYTCLS